MFSDDAIRSDISGIGRISRVPVGYRQLEIAGRISRVPVGYRQVGYLVYQGTLDGLLQIV